MAFLRKKINPRRIKLRKELWQQRLVELDKLTEQGVLTSLLILLVFIVSSSIIISIRVGRDVIEPMTLSRIFAMAGIVVLTAATMAVYVYHYQCRVIKINTRGIAIAGLFVMLLVGAKLAMLFSQSASLISIAVAVIFTSSIILTIAYDQRFAIGMNMFYAVLVWLAIDHVERMDIFITMMACSFTCCFCLKEIRTRMKLIEVSTLTAFIVFLTAAMLGILADNNIIENLKYAGWSAFSVILVGFVIQGLLPIIEKVFRVATSMTLLDYSDASQPLLRKLALDAPGTYSHSLLIGSLAEASADAIGANGLLCRVGAYYHDIGKINKPGYFVENQMGAVSRHKELSPAMSQLIIIGHVKDGIEMAREYKLPAMLRQFVETHHGTTLIEYFYNEAKKRHQDEKTSQISETDFRYAGPKPKTKEAAIVMLADSVEGAVRSLPEISPARIEIVVHNMAMKRLQDGQFDECDLTLRELSKIEASLAKSLAAHYHGRIAYPKSPDMPDAYQHQPIEKIS